MWTQEDFELSMLKTMMISFLNAFNGNSWVLSFLTFSDSNPFEVAEWHGPIDWIQPQLFVFVGMHWCYTALFLKSFWPKTSKFVFWGLPNPRRTSFNRSDFTLFNWSPFAIKRTSFCLIEVHLESKELSWSSFWFQEIPSRAKGHSF